VRRAYTLKEAVRAIFGADLSIEDVELLIGRCSPACTGAAVLPGSVVSAGDGRPVAE
jgi:hypothetical protein